MRSATDLLLTCLEGSKVNHAVNLGVLLEDLVESILVGDVDLVEVGALAAEELNAVDGDLGGVVKAVDDDHIVAVLKKSEGGKRADVAGATVSHRSARLAFHRALLALRRQCDSDRQKVPRGSLSRPLDRRIVCRVEWSDLPGDQDGSNRHCKEICWLERLRSVGVSKWVSVEERTSPGWFAKG